MVKPLLGHLYYGKVGIGTSLITSLIVIGFEFKYLMIFYKIVFIHGKKRDTTVVVSRNRAGLYSAYTTC